ncbi:ABC transporter substrate-binding protein [Photobacterium sp. DNB23_23_1]
MKKLMLASAGLLFSLSGQAGELVFASWGGAYQDAIRNAWLTPFSEQTNIEIIEDTDPETAKIKVMVDTNSMTWDVVSGGGVAFIRGVQLGLFEEIPQDIVDQSHVLDDARKAYGVPTEIYSNLVGYSLTAFPDGKEQPQSFADFWDTERFPGKRTLPAKPETVLEAALLAEGVAPNEVYTELSKPEGLDRAFKKVEELLPHVSVFWSSSAQPVQMLGSGEVTLAIGSNGRFQSGIDHGLPIAMSWNEQVPQVGYMMIPKGAENIEEAMAFLNFILQPENNAKLSEYVSYGPITEIAWDYIDEERAKRLPSTPERLEKAVFVDTVWWSENSLEVTERYTRLIKG